jgi:hypothetical protein
MPVPASLTTFPVILDTPLIHYSSHTSLTQVRWSLLMSGVLEMEVAEAGGALAARMYALQQHQQEAGPGAQLAGVLHLVAL